LQDGIISPAYHIPRTAAGPALMQGEHEFTTDEEDNEDDADFSGFDEPIMIRMMANMQA